MRTFLPFLSSTAPSVSVQEKRRIVYQRLRVVNHINRKRRQPMRNPLIMFMMVLLMLVVVLMIFAFFTYAPLFCACWCGIMYLIGIYLSNESRWWIHDAQEFENRFWTMTAFLFSTALLYIRDSPLAIGRWHPLIGWFLVAVFTLFIHFLDRFIHRQAISRRTSLNSRAYACPNLYKYKATAEEKAKVVSDCVNQIDRIYLPSTINNMINYTQVKRQQQKIYRILMSATRNELNFVVNNVKLALLFYKVKDQSAKLRSDQHRTMILDLLCVQRVSELTITSRAILLDALMVMRLSAHPSSEKWARNIILKTSGDDLSLLKTYTDAKGDFHSMHKLIFNDIRNDKVRNDILQHIRREAGVQTAHMRLGTRKAMVRKLQAWRKVLSDVDDTLYSSGGRYPAGIDTRYPRHAVYPGVLSFYRELDIGTSGPDEWAENRVGNLVFLSARPHVYKDMAEKKSYAKFAALYSCKKMHTLPTMLAGSLKSGRAYMVQGDLGPMAQKKFENFCEFYQLYPEFKHVLIGDNGQGDVLAAQLIAEKFGSDVLEAGYFHLVQPIERTYGVKSKEDLEKCHRMRIVFFNTYIGAAVEAYNLRQIRVTGLQRIATEAVETFVSIITWTSSQERERQRLNMNRDIERANAILVSENMRTVEHIAKPQLFPLNVLVRTPFGRAMVRKYRCTDGMYKVELLDWKTQKRFGYLTEDSLAPFARNLSANFDKSSCTYIKFYRAPVKVLAPNTLVKTHFGHGRVIEFRHEDDIYVVQLTAADGKLFVPAYLTADLVHAAELKQSNVGSPTMFAGVRSKLGYFTRALSSFVPSSACGSKAIYANKSIVESVFGRAAVGHFRSVDRVYELKLLKPSTSGCRAFVHEQYLRERENVATRGFFSILWAGADKNLAENVVDGLPEEVKLNTPYGAGIIQKYSQQESVFKVLLLDLSASNSPVIGYFASPFVQERLISPDMSAITAPISNSGTDQGTRVSSNRMRLFQLLRYVSSSRPSTPYAGDGANKRVETPLGFGSTSMSRPYKGCYKVQLDGCHLADTSYYTQEYDIIELPKSSSRRNTLEFLGSYLWHSSYPPATFKSNVSIPPRNTIAADTYSKQSIPKIPAGSVVSTIFGEGRLSSIRTNDAICIVQFGSHIGYFQCTNVTQPIRGKIGHPVIAVFGSGILQAVRATDHAHIVSMRHAIFSESRVLAYVQPRSVIGAIQAARGDMVHTPYGLGIVSKYRPQDHFYIIALHSISDREHAFRDPSSIAIRPIAYIRAQDVTLMEEQDKSSSKCKLM